ncbi:MAG: hypothetical protein C4292_05020, partial [Nitrososphaera sp.]
SLTTSSTGAVVSSSKYYPYGADRPGGSGTLPTDYKFTGQRQDANIGLYDFNARFYDPLLGRFLSADTIVPGAGNPQALNRYSYVLNGPLNYVDPTGHCLQGPAGNDCRDKQNNLQLGFGVRIDGDWTEDELTKLDDALTAIRNAVK